MNTLKTKAQRRTPDQPRINKSPFIKLWICNVAFLACSQGSYGQNCINLCLCQENQHCSAVHGCSSCPDGFDVHNCSIDINECLSSTHNCDLDVSICNNTSGGYNCICLDGYAMNPLSHRCIGKTLL